MCEIAIIINDGYIHKTNNLTTTAVKIDSLDLYLYIICVWHQWLLWIVRARSANRSAPQEAPALIIIFDSLMLERSA